MNGLLLSVLVVIGQADAQPESQREKVTDAERGEETVRLAQIEAARYKIVRDDDRQEPLELHDKSILKWSNATNGALYGSVVLWTVDGRPEAIASLYRWYVDKQKFHAEFKSLSLAPLKATRGGNVVWEPRKAGLEFRELAGEEPPAESANRRLKQMRDFARRFSGKVVPPDESATELRLLTQPLYRYERTPQELVDGALFVFVQGTDPEIVLLIEAEKTTNGARWRYAVGRLNMFELRLSLDDKEVWSVERVLFRDVIDPQGAYAVLMLDY